MSVTDFSVHDIALVDSPAFHFVMDTVTNGEVYNMIVRGGNRGGLDGFNLMAAKNVHVHDVAVTNKDEWLVAPFFLSFPLRRLENWPWCFSSHPIPAF